MGKIQQDQEERNKQWREAASNCHFHCKDGFFYDKINDVMRHCKCVIEAGLIENKQENQIKNLTLFDRQPAGVILFWDKSKIFITNQEMDAIKNIDSSSFEVKGNVYNFNQISKILYLDEYYNQYPDQRPQQQKFFDFEEDNKNRRSAYQELYSSKEYCERAIIDFTRNIEMRKEKGLPYGNVQALLNYVKNKLTKICMTQNPNASGQSEI